MATSPTIHDPTIPTPVTAATVSSTSALHQTNIEAIASLHSNTTKIFWLHVPKAGTSLFNTIYLHYCSSIISANPAIISGAKPLMDMTLLKLYPPTEYCNASDANMPCPGCHWPYPKSKDMNMKYHFFAMFRHPIERLKSAYAFNRHRSKLNDKNISFDTYVNETHIPNCQLKMMLGCKCYDEVNVDTLNTTLAIQRALAPNFYFGITDRWVESICLFHSIYGGEIRGFELKNNRPTRRSNDTVLGMNYTFIEMEFYNALLDVFDMRVREAGCLVVQ